MSAWGSAGFSPQPQPQPRRVGGGRLLAVIAVVAALFAAGALKFPQWLPSFNSPLTTTTVDRSAPPVLKALEDLAEYRAATGHFEVVIDVEKDAKYFPSILKGERTLFVAAGTVDGIVDFSTVTESSVTVSEDRRAVVVRLPHAELGTVRVDPAKSYVFASKRGALDRIGDVFSSNPAGEQEFYQLAEQKMRTAAQGDDGIVARSEVNTRAMLTSLLTSLGFTDVTVEFTAGTVPAA